MKISASTTLHSLARRSLKKLTLPEPIARYRKATTERINTNPYAGEYGIYPCPNPIEVQAKYAKYLIEELKIQHGKVSFSAENILFTPGSIVAIDLLIRAFCEPLIDQICIQNPTFPAYRNYALGYDIEVVDVPLIGDCLNALNTDAIAAAKAKLTFICNPNNPVSSILSQEQLIDVLKQSSGLVIVDEAYIDFSEQDSSIKLITEYPNLVVLRTFSKAWGFAGLRIGVVIGEPSILYTLRLLLDPFSFTLPAQKAVANVLDNLDLVQSNVKRIKSERERLYLELEQISIVKRVYPSQTNFILLEFFNSSIVYESLVKANALVSDTSFQIKNSLRISISVREENERILGILKRIVS
jgi:histidinol-phosphate aminotransferase